MAGATTGDEVVHARDSSDLVAAGDSVCIACGNAIRAGWVVRTSPAGTRHDVCP